MVIDRDTQRKKEYDVESWMERLKIYNIKWVILGFIYIVINVMLEFITNINLSLESFIFRVVLLNKNGIYNSELYFLQY